MADITNNEGDPTSPRWRPSETPATAGARLAKIYGDLGPKDFMELVGQTLRFYGANEEQEVGRQINMAADHIFEAVVALQRDGS